MFFTCYFLFAKYFPVIAVAEIKFVLKTSGRIYKEKMDVYEKMNEDEYKAMIDAAHHDHEDHGTHDAPHALPVAEAGHHNDVSTSDAHTTEA